MRSGTGSRNRSGRPGRAPVLVPSRDSAPSSRPRRRAFSMEAMGRRGSIPLARVMGIRIGVDVSWFFVLFLCIWILSSGYKDTFGRGHDDKAFALAVVSAFLFFFAVVLHEFGHAIVARRNGILITSINLWMFGGMAEL